MDKEKQKEFDLFHCTFFFVGTGHLLSCSVNNVQSSNIDLISNPSATHHPLGGKVWAKLTHFEIRSAESIFARVSRQSNNSPWSYFANFGFHYFSISPINESASFIPIPSETISTIIITILKILRKGFHDQSSATIL